MRILAGLAELSVTAYAAHIFLGLTSSLSLSSSWMSDPASIFAPAIAAARVLGFNF